MKKSLMLFMFIALAVVFSLTNEKPAIGVQDAEAGVRVYQWAWTCPICQCSARCNCGDPMCDVGCECCGHVLTSKDWKRYRCE